jgi:hypothetical protein
VIDPQGNFLAPLPLAQKSLTALLAVPVLQADKKDLTAQVDAEKTALANSDKALGLERQAHASDNAACTADKKSLSAQIDKVKADARRSKFKWFLTGFVSGAATVLLHVI